jgi:hypothetical protein
VLVKEGNKGTCEIRVDVCKDVSPKDIKARRVVRKSVPRNNVHVPNDDCIDAQTRTHSDH